MHDCLLCGSYTCEKCITSAELDYATWKVRWAGSLVHYDVHEFLYKNSICCLPNWRWLARAPPGNWHQWWECYGGGGAGRATQASDVAATSAAAAGAATPEPPEPAPEPHAPTGDARESPRTRLVDLVIHRL